MSLIDRIAAIAARVHGLEAFPIIETPRLRLRGPRGEDAEPLFAQFSHPAVMRYWSRPAMRGVEEARAYLQEIVNGFAKRTLINWIIAERDSDAMLGTCTLYDIQPSHMRCGVGYALHPRNHGHGYASEAVRHGCDWAFDTLGLHRVEADIHPGNAPSRAVLERCGFRREGLLRERFVTPGEIQDSEIYALLSAERAATR